MVHSHHASFASVSFASVKVPNVNLFVLENTMYLKGIIWRRSWKQMKKWKLKQLPKRSGCNDSATGTGSVQQWSAHTWPVCCHLSLSAPQQSPDEQTEKEDQAFEYGDKNSTALVQQMMIWRDHYSFSIWELGGENELRISYFELIMQKSWDKNCLISPRRDNSVLWW